MKKKFGTLSFMMGMAMMASAHAQYYNNAPQYNYSQPRAYGTQGYNQAPTYYTNSRPAYVPPQYRVSDYKYIAPQKTVQNSIYDNRFTVGLDYQMGFASYKDTSFEVETPLPGGQNYNSSTRNFDRQIQAIQLNLGWRVSRNWGLEAFYTHSLDNKKVKFTDSYTGYPLFAQGSYTMYYRAYGLDLLGYYPVNSFMEFIASVGLAKYDAEAKVKVSVYEDNTHTSILSNSQKFTDSMIGYRIGGGLQFLVSRHIAFRLMGRWTQLGGDYMKYITEVNAGVRYYF